MKGVEETVRAIVAGQLNLEPGDINPEDDFVTKLGADSLDIVEVVMEIEDQLNIIVPDADVEKLRSVSAAVEYIEKLKA